MSILSGVEKLYKIYRAYEEEMFIFHKRTKRTDGGLKYHLFQME
jgi:hypothetical protein